MASVSIPQRVRHSDERGIALLMALVAIIVIGALITGTFFAGRMEVGSGRNAVANTQAQEAAETGLVDAFSNWNMLWNSYAVDVNMVQATAYPIPSRGLRYTQTIRRMTGGLYLVTSMGERVEPSGTVSSTRYLATLAKLTLPWLYVDAAVTSRGNTRVGGNATIRGENTTPTGWPACAGPDKAGIRTNDDVIFINGTPQITGTPPYVEDDPTVVDSIFTKPYQQILPLVTLTLSPGTYNGMTPSVTGSPAVCNRSDANNWGEPSRGAGSVSQCYTYFPIIYSPGDLHVTGGRGQGILMVDGELRMQGGFEFTGVVLVRGQVITTANSSKVTGAILAQNVDFGDLTAFGGTPVVQYSKCAIEEALQHSGVGTPLADRAWAQVNPR